MDDLISRQAVLSLHIYTEKNLYGNIIREYVDIEDVKQLPSAEPHVKPRREERKIGEWIYDWGDWDFETCKCSECGNHMTTPIGERYSFCPNCGADMREVTK